jgi:multidrug/hemolysin transport system ATP-binding protein
MDRLEAWDYEQRAKQILSKLNITRFDQPVGELSGGQIKRLALANVLITEPDLLILDEPTTGLDPQTRKKVWEVISYLRESQGLTVFLTTHYMEEAADADKVVIIDSGKIVAEGTPVELKNRYTGDFITVYGKTETDMELLGVKYEKVGDGYRFKVENTADAKALIVSHPDFFDDYEIVKGKMDDVFLAATGKRLSVEDEKSSKKGGRSK